MVNLITVIGAVFVPMFLFVFTFSITGDIETAIDFAAVGLIVFFALSTALAKRIHAGKRGKVAVRSSDGHIIRRDEDLTCNTNDGHNHPDNSSEFGRRYIVHNEPNEGYVVLNGQMHRIEDCKNL